MKNKQLGMRAAIAISAAMVFTGCGGGSSASSSPTPTPSANLLALSGSASNGMALPNQSIAAKCAIGSGSGTTTADGTYALTIENGKWPCVARVSGPDGNTLHTLALGTGNSATANLTPVTQLVLARLAGADPAAYYAAFDASAAAAVTAPSVASAQSAVVTMLKSAGLDLSGTGDLLGAPLTSTYTTVLKLLTSTLTSSNTKLADLTTSVVNSAPSTVAGLPVATVGTPSLPAAQLLQPGVSTCAALRKGSYRIVLPTANVPLSEQFGKIAVTDTATLAIAFSDGSTGHWTATGPCSFSDDGGKSSIVVSPAGVIVARYIDSDGVTLRLALAFPDQNHAPSELVGNWSLLGVNGKQGVFAGISASVALDATGAFSGSLCGNDTLAWSLAACSTAPPGSLAMKANSDGGFDSLESGALYGRMFAYQAGGGEMMLVKIDPDGSFTIGTRQRVATLPSVGEHTSSWTLAMNDRLLANTPMEVSSNTIVSVDAATASWVRKHASLGANDEHAETLYANKPRDGYHFRAAGTALAADGSVAAISQITSLNMRGMGLSVALNQSKNRIQLSVNQP
jgi:hypothetical protein